MKVRIISAAVAILIALPFVLIGGTFYKLAIGILAVLAFKEIYSLPKSHNKIPMIPAIIALVSLLFMVFVDYSGIDNIFGISSSILILLILVNLLPTIFYKNNKYMTKDALYLIGIAIFLGISFNNFILIRNYGLLLFLYLVLIPITTDTFAMLVGCKYGKHKMCPKLSPKKSWEGFIAGFVLGSIIPIVFYVIFVGKFSFSLIISTMILSTMGQLGDLVFSKIKRENEIKDFSNIMPGHGGVLDRLDSTIVIFMTYILLKSIL